MRLTHFFGPPFSGVLNWGQIGKGTVWYSNRLWFVELGFYQVVAGRPGKVLNVMKEHMSRVLVSNGA